MVKYREGHKNSKGEDAPWCIISHDTGKVISSHKSREAAEKHLKDIQMFKHMKTESALSEYGVRSQTKDALDIFDQFERITWKQAEDGLKATALVRTASYEGAEELGKLMARTLEILLKEYRVSGVARKCVDSDGPSHEGQWCIDLDFKKKEDVEESRDVESEKQMSIEEALRIIRRSRFSITEARSFDRSKKEAAARRLIDAFHDWTYDRSKKPLTDEEKRIADDAAAPFSVNDVARWANNRGKDLFDRKERETLYYLEKSNYEKRLKDSREAERRQYIQNNYNRYKKCQEDWPEYKRKVVDKLVANGYEVVKIEYADHYYDFNELMKNIKDVLPDAEPLDGSEIPYKITMRVENSVDSFRFETPINIDQVTLGNSDPLRILAQNSNGKAKACAALERYRDENRNTWYIPMDIFMPAAIEFAHADDFLDDEEAAAVKKSAAASDAFEAGASEFYRTAKYQGD